MGWGVIRVGIRVIRGTGAIIVHTYDTPFTP